jgi:4-hydroxy-4-methyl-2-oxoglutarate aldolase
MVVDGCVRDVDRFPLAAVPVFARGTCIRGTGKDPLGNGAINVPVQVGDVLVHPGDFVVGDADGVVVLATDSVDRAIDAGCLREERESHFISQIQAGQTTMQIYELPGWEDADQAPGQSDNNVRSLASTTKEEHW